jgi:hypothetical protein
MLVKAAKNCLHCSQIFLDSEEDHHDPNNLAIAISVTGAARFKEARIDDPALSPMARSPMQCSARQ